MGIASLLVATGCGLGVDYPAAPEEFVTPTTVAGRPDAPSVLVVGDSITQFSQAEVSFTLSSRGWANATVGHTGTTVEDNRGRIKGAADQDPDVLVIALGTNDALEAGNPTEVRSPARRADLLDATSDQIDAALDDAAGVACVVWVEVADWISTPVLRTTGTGAAINEVLASQADARPSLHIAPYAATFRPATDEARAFLSTNFDPEGLHPVSPAARGRYAQLVADTVGSACGI